MSIGKSALIVALAGFAAAGSGLRSQGTQGGATSQSRTPATPSAGAFRFHLQDATIDDIHRAIRDGQITCQSLVQLYLKRAQAYNGVADELVTQDGASIPAAAGVVRARSALKYPTATVAISTLLPNFDQYAGLPIEFGRMEPTASDPSVDQQYGMTIGMPNAGQLNALGTLNLRGERSVTCKGDRDKKPSDGPLPPGAPAVCEEFRKQPDALERAAELDKQYGRNPDLIKLPMYCVVFSFKDSYDAKDMRSTGGGDAHYDIDFPARDQTLVGELRAKGAIIYAKAVNTEYNGRPTPAIRGGQGAERGTNRPTKVFVSVEGYQRSTWAGNPSEVYDTTRAASLGSSSGSGVSVSANPGDLQPQRRRDQHVLPRAVEPQCGGADLAAEVDDLFPRRGHRRGYLQRPGRHHVQTRNRRRESAGLTEGPRERLLRSARHFHHRAALERSE